MSRLVTGWVADKKEVILILCYDKCYKRCYDGFKEGHLTERRKIVEDFCITCKVYAEKPETLIGHDMLGREGGFLVEGEYVGRLGRKEEHEK